VLSLHSDGSVLTLHAQEAAEDLRALTMLAVIAAMQEPTERRLARRGAALFNNPLDALRPRPIHGRLGPVARGSHAAPGS
jgi:hypothetical protein